jgi:hypothetical protein
LDLFAQTNAGRRNCARWQLAAQTTAVMASARTQPVVPAVEDLQWADSVEQVRPQIEFQVAESPTRYRWRAGALQW